MIICKYTKTIKCDAQKIATILEVSDSSCDADTPSHVLEKLWDKFEQKSSVFSVAKKND
jgi:hypothetical protein